MIDTVLMLLLIGPLIAAIPAWPQRISPGSCPLTECLVTRSGLRIASSDPSTRSEAFLCNNPLAALVASDSYESAIT